MEITLYYFKIPFWRAEVTRLALFIGDIPFNDYRVEGKEIDDLKALLSKKTKIVYPAKPRNIPKNLPFIYFSLILFN